MRITPLDYCEKKLKWSAESMCDNRRIWIEPHPESGFVLGEGDREITIVKGTVYERFYTLLHGQHLGRSSMDAYNCYATVAHCFGHQDFSFSDDVYENLSDPDMNGMQVPFGLQWRRKGCPHHAQVVAAFDKENVDSILFEKVDNLGPYYISGLRHRVSEWSKYGLTPCFHKL